MITALMAQVDLRFPSFEDNYAVSVNSQILLIDTKPRGQLTLQKEFIERLLTSLVLLFKCVPLAYCLRKQYYN